MWDHLIQDSDATKANYGDVAAHPELVDVACNGRATPAFWNHMNSLEYNAKLDQIALSVRGCNEIWIIDHGTTTKQAASHTGVNMARAVTSSTAGATLPPTAAATGKIGSYSISMTPNGFPMATPARAI